MTGPPAPCPEWSHCAATAYVPPRTADTGLASFILRNGSRDRRTAVPLAISCWPSPMSWVAPVSADARLPADPRIRARAGFYGNRWQTVPRWFYNDHR